MYRALVLNRVDEFKRLSEEMGIKNWKILGMMILFRPIEGYRRLNLINIMVICLISVCFFVFFLLLLITVETWE
jgi:hypothetical protein